MADRAQDELDNAREVIKRAERDDVQKRAGGPFPGAYRHPVRQADKHHLTGKPTDLMVDLLRPAEPGALVLDPFAGSGTTGVAALRRGCRFLGFDLSAEYCALGAMRLEAELRGLGLREHAAGQGTLFGPKESPHVK